jgi:disulfide bond formation protein DsbB
MNCPQIHKLAICFTPNRLHCFLIAISALSLAAAYIAEYGFGISPCDFCLYERGVYVGVILVGILGLKTHTFSNHRGVFIQLIVLSIGIALTFYHVGMEQHWWAGPASCTGVGTAATLEEFRAQLMKVTRPRCDQVSWSLLGISAALWNLMLQAGLAFVTSLGLYTPDQPIKKSFS